MGHITKPNAKLKIHLENEKLVMYGSPTESSGCVLRGALTLCLKRSTRFKSLVLSFHGSMSVSWSQLLGSGYERKHKDRQILFDHTWSFLPAQPHKDHLLSAGNHSFEFELVLPGKLPESTHVAKYYLVQYHLEANAERSSFLMPNYTTRRDIHLSRQKLSLGTDYFDPIMITNHWANKLDYEINMPTKVYSHGDTIPISIQAIALAPNLTIRYIACTFKEYMTCRAINGWFNGKNKSHGRIIQYTRVDQEGPKRVLNYQQGDDAEVVWSTTMTMKVPESMLDIQCDAHNESVRVRHKLKFTMSIENGDGHISELRAVLPIVITISNTTGGLPAYEETWRSLPYDPAVMMTLIRRAAETNTIPHHGLFDLITNYRLRNHLHNAILPSYSSITLRDDGRASLPSYDDI
ncbi:hypothetical protein EDC94DRAFT_650944 [Helicostylum pulchrum]|uniref:Arrestin C-terminal-like domain-containing protein n=1 Tax=Helicostylum pulchrum TaxID=562976 RepID=A0ABP9XX18_9FUNG|nr:hypothetical protein EDC94DRAFT_650944 [Helicostylum pulchrum]